MPRNHETVTSRNPGVRFFNNQRGYVRCTVTPKTWQADYMVVAKVTEPNCPVNKAASFVVEAGRSGAQSA